MVKLERISIQKTPLSCSCLCHTGKCNHTSSPCHEKYLITETYRLILPDRPPIQFDHEYVYDNYKTCVETFDIENLLSKSFKVFKYVNHDSDFYSYYNRTTYVIKNLKNCYSLENVPHLFRRPAIYTSHSDSISEFATYVLVPFDITEAEWTVTRHEITNVPHNYEITMEDPKTGEKYIELGQCWGRKEEWITERYYYKDGKITSIIINFSSKCTGSCSTENEKEEV
jgi:hypothetical protein